MVNDIIVTKYGKIITASDDKKIWSGLKNFLPTPSAPIFNIFGHIPQDEVVFGVNFVAIDTGCGRGEDRKLSAYCIESKEVITVGCCP